MVLLTCPRTTIPSCQEVTNNNDHHLRQKPSQNHSCPEPNQSRLERPKQHDSSSGVSYSRNPEPIKFSRKPPQKIRIDYLKNTKKQLSNSLHVQTLSYHIILLWTSAEKESDSEPQYSGVPNNHTGMLIYFGEKSRGVLLLF